MLGNRDDNSPGHLDELQHDRHIMDDPSNDMVNTLERKRIIGRNPSDSDRAAKTKTYENRRQNDGTEQRGDFGFRGEKSGQTPVETAQRHTSEYIELSRPQIRRTHSPNAAPQTPPWLVPSEPMASAPAEDSTAKPADRPQAYFVPAPPPAPPQTREDKPAMCFPSLEEIKEEIAARRVRMSDMDGQFFAEPAWDMLLDLALAIREDRQISVSSLCIASGVPETTALRLIQRLVDNNWLTSDRDIADRRRRIITLSDKAKMALARYFSITRREHRLHSGLTR